MPNPLTRRLTAPWDGALRSVAVATAAGLKAALPVGRPRPTGRYVGDPIAGGVWVEGTPWGSWRDGGGFDYARAVGNPDQSSIVMGCLRALQRAAAEPRPRVYRPDASAQDELNPVRGRPPLECLLLRPNRAFSRTLLTAWEVASLHLTGEAFYWKARSAAGRVVALEPLQPWRVRPVPGPTTDRRILRYDYQGADYQEPVQVPVKDILHLRLELDPDDLTRGRSPLRSVLKHVFTDEEATDFCNSLLRNYALPPAIFTPDPSAAPPAPVPQEKLDQIKTEYVQRFGGTRRGEPMFLGAPWKLNTVAFNPQQMLLDKLQQLPESRICAAMGVPPIVCYFQIGLANATFSNAEQFQEAFVKNTLVPYWANLAEQYSFDLIPEFYGEDAEEEVRYDLTEVSALQEDEGQKVERYTKLVLAGCAFPNEARRAIGLPDLTDADVLYIPSNVTPTEPADLIPEPEPEPVAAPQPVEPVEVPEAFQEAAPPALNGRAR